MKRKGLLVLQFHPGDQAMAYRLARLIRMLQPSMSKDFDFMFAYRRDVVHVQDMTLMLKKSFDVLEVWTKDVVKGWPAGPNNLWLTVMRRVLACEGQYDFVLTFEPDCCPLTCDWLTKLRQAWYANDAYVMGHMHPTVGANGHQDHINGNAMFSADPNFLKDVLLHSSRFIDKHGWDTQLAGLFKDYGWKDIPEIRSWYGRHSLRVDEFQRLVKEKAVFLHGVKNGSDKQIASTFLLPRGKLT
jgi:hypothetical protein